jgi:hypothetical protein
MTIGVHRIEGLIRKDSGVHLLRAVGIPRQEATTDSFEVHESANLQCVLDLLPRSLERSNLRLKKAVHQQLPWIKQMMPVRPSTCPNRLCCFLSRLNLPGWNESFFLPFCESLFQQRENQFFARQVFCRGFCIVAAAG